MRWSAPVSGCHDLTLWLDVRDTQLAVRTRDAERAEAGFERAWNLTRSRSDFRDQAQIGVEWARMLLQRSLFSEARRVFEYVLAIEEHHRPQGLGVVRVRNWLGDLANRERDSERAESHFRRADELARRVAPASGAAATAALNLAASRWQRGDLEGAQILSARALEIRERLTPDGAGLAAVLLTQGNVLFARGELVGAESAFGRAREILERSSPTSASLPKVFHNLGVLASLRGDREAAESLFGRELTFYRSLDPAGPHLREALLGLAELALRNRDGPRAEELLRQALDLSRSRGFVDTKTAWTLRALADAALLGGRTEEAKGHLDRALEIAERIAPETLEVASARLQRGVLAAEQGLFEEAEKELAHARRIADSRPNSLAVDALHATARLEGLRR